MNIITRTTVQCQISGMLRTGIDTHTQHASDGVSPPGSVQSLYIQQCFKEQGEIPQQLHTIRQEGAHPEAMNSLWMRLWDFSILSYTALFLTGNHKISLLRKTFSPSGQNWVGFICLVRSSELPCLFWDTSVVLIQHQVFLWQALLW